MEGQSKEKKEAAEVWQEHHLVFTTTLGTPIHPDNINRALRGLIKLAGVRRIRVHDLRGTHATLARRAGRP